MNTENWHGGSKSAILFQVPVLMSRRYHMALQQFDPTKFTLLPGKAHMEQLASGTGRDPQAHEAVHLLLDTLAHLLVGRVR